jgi:Flp pilus assembly protein TadD
MKRSRRQCFALLAGTLLLGSLACSGQRNARPVGRLELESLIRSRGLEPTHVVVPYRLSPEMRKFAQEAVPKSAINEDERLHYLSAALFSADGLDIEYVRGHTGTAREVFETQQANCLAFTHLFVGMARAVGVPVFFVAVRDLENYRKEGELIVVSDHVAVGFGTMHELGIIDFARPEGLEYRNFKIVDDYRAISMFYSNRGAEQLRLGRFEEALAWLRSAVAIDPEYGASWVNLGVALRRSGDLENAEIAYRTALELDLHSTSALQNLAALLNQRGEDAEALELLELADRSSNRNPFTYLTLGDLSLRHGKVDAAGRFYRKALRRQGENADSYAAMGLWHLRLGEMKKANSWLERAVDLDPDSQRVDLLRQRIAAQRSDV